MQHEERPFGWPSREFFSPFDSPFFYARRPYPVPYYEQQPQPAFEEDSDADEDSEELDARSEQPAVASSGQQPTGPVRIPITFVRPSSTMKTSTSSSPPRFRRGAYAAPTAAAAMPVPPVPTPVSTAPTRVDRPAPPVVEQQPPAMMKQEEQPQKEEENAAQRERKRMLDRLQLYGLKERQVKGDGNCQFRALSDQLFGTDCLRARHSFFSSDLENRQ